jgi:hypothetical protein
LIFSQYFRPLKPTMLKKITTTFFFLTLFCFAQSEKKITGQINCKDVIAQGIKVLNLNSEKETVSDIEGKFVIMAKTDDLLVFSSNNFDYMRKIIDDNDYKNGSITVTVTPKINQLEEVKINNYPNINAVSLGILDKPAKQYTPAERKLYTATTGGGLVPFDAILNAISGRTKMLKKYVAFEKKQIQVEKLSNMFSDEYYIKQLKIDESLIHGFLYYAVEDEKVVEALSQKNKFLVSFALVKVAENFNKLQNEN